ncbi:MAG TPA: helicase HerA-like domain-containing protein [Thermomicrobiales bacterium]
MKRKEHPCDAATPDREGHALRAFTPRDQKAVRAAAQTFRTNPDLDVETANTELGVGEALVSFLDGAGVPGIVERALVIPPRSRIGPISLEQRRKLINWSHMQGKYDHAIDRKSAYEMLRERAALTASENDRARSELKSAPLRSTRKVARQAALGADEGLSTALAVAAEDAAREFGQQANRGLLRGLLGALLGRRS